LGKQKIKSQEQEKCVYCPHSYLIPSQRVRQEKKNQKIQIGKKEVKLQLFADDMILHLKDSKESTKKTLDLLTHFQQYSRI
jgi:hypothetical protein